MTFILVVLQFYPLVVEDVTSTLFGALEKGSKVERGNEISNGIWVVCYDMKSLLPEKIFNF